MREIITLQLGQQSNYLATHFWNAQESYFTYAGDQQESPIDHDVHFRPGLGPDGTETFMPRTVIYDLKGGFGSMRKINALYDVDDDPASSGLWNGQTSVQKQEPIQPSEYQQSLDAGLTPSELTTSSVRYWSDFSRVFYHPRSVIQLNEYELNSTIMPFEKWHMGEELFGSLDKEHDIVDRDLRPFIEEADQMQGLQLMTGIDDAWGGFAAKYVEKLRDEYGKTPIWVWGAQEPVNGLSRDKRLLKLVNKARALAEMNTQASLIVPLALPQKLPNNVQLDTRSMWHVTALLSAAVESTTLYTRLKTTDRVNSSNLSNFADLLNVFGKQTIASLAMSVEDPPEPQQGGAGEPLQNVSGQGSLFADVGRDAYAGLDGAASEDEDKPLGIDLSSPEEADLNGSTFRKRRKRHIFSQIATYRGPEHPQYSTTNTTKAEQASSHRLRNRPKVHSYQSSSAFPIIDSYPKILRDKKGQPFKDEAPLRTTLSVDSSVTDRMKGLRSMVIRSIGLEDREMVGNELAEMAEGYKDGWSSGSDDDDDED